MQLSNRALNRTLWLRQHLVTPSSMDPVEMTEQLIGLQAQENLPPYLSLRARIKDFDPASLSTAIEDRRLVRLLTMRGTVHVLTPVDALSLRPWVQPALDRLSKGNQMSLPAAHIPPEDLVAATRDVLRDGALPVAELGLRLAELFPDAPAHALRHVARERVAMAQVPPRGLWNRSGGVVYDLADTWLGRPLTDVDLPALVRRYLRAFGPASAADMTKWSLVSRLGPVFKAMDDLVQHAGPDGRVLHDVADGPIADEDLELPVRMLGNYDNIWLSHANRERIATDEHRRKWMGPNGGNGAGLFLDGFLAGHWRRDDGEITVTPYRDFSRTEKAAVATEVEEVRDFLAR